MSALHYERHQELRWGKREGPCQIQVPACVSGAIAASLALRELKYQEADSYCHFGRVPYTTDGIKIFEGENVTDLAKYKSTKPLSAVGTSKLAQSAILHME